MNTAGVIFALVAVGLAVAVYVGFLVANIRRFPVVVKPKTLEEALERRARHKPDIAGRCVNCCEMHPCPNYRVAAAMVLASTRERYSP